MKDGDIVINDSGAESPLHYAGDITRTFPAGGTFTTRQRDVYALVLKAQEEAIGATAPGVLFRDVHLHASRVLAAGLKDLGLMRGDVEEAVAAGAHALFFPHGLGHMLGLDVHDMEGLGEDYVGYTDTIRRSRQFGLASLRLARALEPGFAVTVEPGLYFIPALIDRWKADRTHDQFINYAAAEGYKDFGGVRVEDDILVLEDGCRVLGKSIPKSVTDVQALASG
jgi:Xaa-Pro aminopeptidase